MAYKLNKAQRMTLTACIREYCSQRLRVLSAQRMLAQSRTNNADNEAAHNEVLAFYNDEFAALKRICAKIDSAFGTNLSADWS